jgi:hypothetical protein
MKRLLIALATSIVCVVFYYFAAYVISPAILGTPAMTPDPRLNLPIALPAAIFDFVAPNALQEAFLMSPGGAMLLGLFFLIANVILFAIPIYLLIILLSPKRP